jgi:hypothetical protein
MDIDLTREGKGACGLCRKMWNSEIFSSIGCYCLIEAMSPYVEFFQLIALVFDSLYF